MYAHSILLARGSSGYDSLDSRGTNRLFSSCDAVHGSLLVRASHSLPCIGRLNEPSDNHGRPSHRKECNELSKERFDPVGDVMRTGMLQCRELLELLPYAAASVLDLPSHPDRLKTHCVFFETCLLPDPTLYDIAGFLDKTIQLPKRVMKILQFGNPKLKLWSGVSQDAQELVERRLKAMSELETSQYTYCRVAFHAPYSGDPFFQYAVLPLYPGTLKVWRRLIFLRPSLAVLTACPFP